MTRADNWRTLLADFIESRRERPFVWGQHDCCLFAADWVALATGQDPAETHRGKYDSVHGDLVGVVIGQKAAFVGEFGLTFAATIDDKYAEFWRF